MNFILFFDNINVSPWAEWTECELSVTRGDNYSLDIQLSGVKLVETAYDYIMNHFPQKIEVYLYYDGIELKGNIYPGDISFFDGYVVADLTLGFTDFFIRKIEGQLLPDSYYHKIPVVISPRTNVQAILTLIVSTFSISYIITKEVFDIQKDMALLLGITGAGPTGPLSATIAQATILALRIVYVAALVVTLVKLVKELFQYIERINYVKGCNLYEALEYFSNNAGFTLNVPTWLKNVWIVGGDKTEYESGELFLIAKQLTNSYVYVANGTVKLISNTTSFPQQFIRAYTDSYKYNYNDIARKEILSFIRDTADDHCLDEPAAIEITRGVEFKGYTRTDISVATAKVAGDRPILQFVAGFLNVLSVFSQKIAEIQETYNAAKGYIIVEREIFSKKIVYSSNYANVPNNHMHQLLNTMANYYVNNRLMRIYSDVIMPLSFAEVVSMINNGFQGVISLKWNPHTEKASVTYQIVAANIPDNYVII